MNDIDKKIRDALRAEDSKWFDEVSVEPSMLAQSLATMRGQHRGFVVMVMIVGAVFMVLAVLATIQFIQAQDQREMILWGAGAFFCFLAVMAMKLWFWLELNKNSVTREIKRVELQIAHLSGRLDSALEK